MAKSSVILSLTCLLACLFLSSVRADIPITFRRICKNGTDNIIYFRPSLDTCTNHFKYTLWGRNGTSGPYTELLSTTQKNQDSVIHSGANPVGNPTRWSYFIVINDSCGPDFQTFSDTVFVDETPPENTFLDSVSVDPLTNQVLLRWKPNISPDFAYYIVYYQTVAGTYAQIYAGKDTSILDNRSGLNPVNQPIKYDISPVDSCGNAKVFDVNPHTTIHLTYTIDTCTRKVRLSWTSYVGWPAIRSYYIYKRIENGPEIFIDSVSGSVLTYEDTITLGLEYRYYVRAFNLASSTSNGIVFTTRYRNEPNNIYLSLASITSDRNDQLLVEFNNNSQEVFRIDLMGQTQPSSVSNLLASYTFNNSFQGNTQVTISYQPDYPILSIEPYNRCGEAFSGINKSTVIRLEASGDGISNRLSWNSYFTWNTGVQHYRIYRGTTDNQGVLRFLQIDSVSNSDSSYEDLSPPTQVGERGVCYYVGALQNSGDRNGYQAESRSTTICIIGKLRVFVPNAFAPEGVNAFFRPEGSFIDYDASEMEIYDRWGGLQWKQSGIRFGWNGYASTGERCKQGVYYYKIKIIGSNGETKTIDGLVTLLD